jgi:hypothetical protein
VIGSNLDTGTNLSHDKPLRNIHTTASRSLTVPFRDSGDGWRPPSRGRTVSHALSHRSHRCLFGRRLYQERPRKAFSMQFRVGRRCPILGCLRRQPQRSLADPENERPGFRHDPLRPDRDRVRRADFRRRLGSARKRAQRDHRGSGEGAPRQLILISAPPAGRGGARHGRNVHIVKDGRRVRLAVPQKVGLSPSPILRKCSSWNDWRKLAR